MCAARPGPLFFTLFPLLTRGGIINPTLKTACRDRARFRRDFRSLKIPTRLHFSLHIHFSLYFLSGFTVPPLPSFLHSHPVSSFSSFPLPSLCNLCTNVKLTVYSARWQPSSHSFPKIRDSFFYFISFGMHTFWRKLIKQHFIIAIIEENINCEGIVMINVSYYAVFRRLIRCGIIRCLIELFKRTGTDWRTRLIINWTANIVIN